MGATMNDANYRKLNDHTHNSSTYHKKDGTPVRAILKEELRKEVAMTERTEEDRYKKKARLARNRLMKFLNGDSPYRDVVICDFCSNELMPIWRDVRAALDGVRDVNE